MSYRLIDTTYTCRPLIRAIPTLYLRTFIQAEGFGSDLALLHQRLAKMERHALGKSQPAMPPSKAVEGEKSRGVEAKVGAA